ncbi:MAG TPA: prepilin-type N-terminal cleavage/methylation domain-containing protein [Chthoniobacteraceae bacterium]|nr:prepilin-type N-terminal cleavage/methylation domain-containing protein [Chthoniobacteraceae bacterium]
MKQDKAAFSLVELLVGIVVIAVLASLVLAAALRMGASSRNAECLSRLRQVGGALFRFANDHNGKIPGRAFQAEGESAPIVWHRILVSAGYVQAVTSPPGDGTPSSPIFYCPSFYPKGPAVSIHAHMRYGMRVWAPPGKLSSDTELLPLSAIAVPSGFFLVADSYYTARKSQGYQITHGSRDWTVDLRHSGTSNTLFADGHIEAKGADYFESLPLYQGQYGAGRGHLPFHTHQP